MLTDNLGKPQTVNLSVDIAVTLGLVTKNPDGSITVNDVVGQFVSIDASTVLTDPCKSSEGAQQPVGKALSDYFCRSLGVDYDTVQAYHADGFGYGEIAQACFMAQALGGDAALCGSILDAKKSGDFSSLVLSSGDTPKNWGQLKKDVLGQEVKSLTNLGAIVSGRANNSSNTTTDVPVPMAAAPISVLVAKITVMAMAKGADRVRGVVKRRGIRHLLL